MSGTSRVAFVGAGQMGMPMVRRLVDAGHDVVAFARRDEVRVECVAAGASATDDVRGAVADAEVVVVCVFSDDQFRELAVGEGGFLAAMRPGSILISHTTGSPATTRALADIGADRDVHVVEAPVSGSAQDIAEGHVTVLLSGDPADVDRARGIVTAYGDPVLTIGPLGAAPVVKLLNNALLAAQLQLAGEVERIMATFGVDMATAAAVIQQSSGSSFAMGLVERNGSLEAVAASAGQFLQKDVAVIEQVAAELGLDLGLIGQVNRDGPVTFNARAGE